MRLLSLILVLTLISSSINLVLAQDSLDVKTPKIKIYKDEKLSVNFGGFLANLKSDISIMSDNLGVGVIINLEDALGLQSTSTVLRGSVGYSFGKTNRHTLNVGYFSLLRKSTKTLEKEFEFGDHTYRVGAEISSKYNFQIITSSYDYSFYKDERVKLAASVGFFIMPVKFSLTTPNTTEEATDFIAPLPVIGLHNSFAITPKFKLIQNIDFFYFKVSYIKGYITDINASLEYTPFNYLGFGIGLNSFNFDLSTNQEDGGMLDFEGEIKTGYTGMLIYAKFYL